MSNKLTNVSIRISDSCYRQRKHRWDTGRIRGTLWEQVSLIFSSQTVKDRIKILSQSDQHLFGQYLDKFKTELLKSGYHLWSQIKNLCLTFLKSLKK